MAGLDKHPSRLFGAARAPSHLIEKLKAALGASRIATRATQIGIDDTDQSELRKMMALSNNLGSDHHIDLAAAECLDGKTGFFWIAERVA